MRTCTPGAAGTGGAEASERLRSADSTLSIRKMPSDAATLLGDNVSTCPPADGDLVGKVIDDLYRLEAIAGTGGMGTVYRAIQLPSGRTVAFKEDRRLNRSGSWGSPRYMAPEQAAGEDIDARTDLYSLGIIMYEALSGQLPFPSASRLANAVQRLELDPQPLGELWAEAKDHPELTDLIMGLIARDPAERPGSAAMFGATLLQLP